MFPHQELTDLARRKALLQAHIAVNRLECRAAALGLVRPITLIDRGVAFWRRISPYAKLLALPAGLVLSRFFRRDRLPRRRRGGKFATLLSLLPLILRGARVFRVARTALAATRNPPPASTRR